VTAPVGESLFQKAIVVFLVIGFPMVLARLILSRSVLLFLGAGLFVILVFALYLKSFEALILFALAINEEFFLLIPRAPLGKYNFQALLYVILIVVAFLTVFLGAERRKLVFGPQVVGLFLLTVMGIANSFFHGQPAGLSLKAGLGYYLILFYFVFSSKVIDQRKLFSLMATMGVVLTFLNNLQYVFFGRLRIFDYDREMIRQGRLRFLVPEMFLIFTAIFVFAAYLSYKKKGYLWASAYMLGTILIQGQTRAHAWGLFVAVFGLLVLSKKLTVPKALALGIPALAVAVWLLPLLRNTTFGRMFELTRDELSSEKGSIAVRMETYDYYLGEIAKSPLIGRGIWNDLFDAYMGDNPEDVKYKNLHLSDVGLLSLVFHFGLLGVLWLVWLVVKAAKLMGSSLRGGGPSPLYASAGYFLCSLAAMLTLNCLTRKDSVIYLALVLVLIGQHVGSESAPESDRLSP
jgi:hypothetical protein